MNDQSFLDQHQLIKNNTVNDFGLSNKNNWLPLNLHTIETNKSLPQKNLVRSDRVERSLSIHKSVAVAQPDATTADLSSNQPGLNRLNSASMTEPLVLAVASSNRDQFGSRTLLKPPVERPLICTCAVCQGAFDAGLQPDTPVAASSSAVGGVPGLSSNSTATAKIYLDFDGHTTTDTWWNSQYNDNKNIVTPAYSADGDTQTFSSSDIDRITKIWQRVAEDYAPFNVDVTTIEPGNFSGREGLRVVIGGSSGWYGAKAGGVAYINSWRWSSDTPVYVFEDNLGSSEKNTAEAISHEVGHAFGLYHQSEYNANGKKTQEYADGSGKGETGWAPIMGVSYGKNLTTWHNGSNSQGSTSKQDDLAIIASDKNGFGYRTDDHGNTNSKATVLSGSNAQVQGAGIISTMTDVDVFSFMTGAGEVNFNIDVALGPNLDVVAQLWDDSNLLLQNNPSDQLSANLNTFLDAGTYYLHVKNNGQYGRLGQYTINGTIVPNSKAPGTDKLQIGEVGRISSLNHSEQTIHLDRTYTNPVVFAQPLSYNGSDSAIARINNIQSDRFSVHVQEPNYKDGSHTTESFSYLVLEAGTWQLKDGTLLEVGSVNTNATTTSQWETINLGAGFADTPVILSQVQTKNGDDFVRTRQNNAAASSFQLAMEEEEALLASGHDTETVGWMAISAGSGNWSDLSYQAGYTGNQVTERWHTLNLDGFSAAPQLLASVSSYDGADSVGLRYQNLTSSEVKLKLEEDTSQDDETNHTTENVGFLALGGSGILSAQAYDPLSQPSSAVESALGHQTNLDPVNSIGLV